MFSYFYISHSFWDYFINKFLPIDIINKVTPTADLTIHFTHLFQSLIISIALKPFRSTIKCSEA